MKETEISAMEKQVWRATQLKLRKDWLEVSLKKSVRLGYEGDSKPLEYFSQQFRNGLNLLLAIEAESAKKDFESFSFDV